MTPCVADLIIFPGSPGIWRHKPLPFTVDGDSKTTYSYLNGHKIPSSPLLPLFRAIDQIESDPDSTHQYVDWPRIDLVTDRNNLKKLLSWIEPGERGVEDFRIDLQLCGTSTLLMQRWEALTEHEPNPGFGDNFERASTLPGPDCADAILAGHNRIISFVGGASVLSVFCLMIVYSFNRTFMA